MIYTKSYPTLHFNTHKDTLYFIDIETTGLSKEHDSIVVTSILEYSNYMFILHQIQLENESEESTLLSLIIDIINDNAPIYSYNGRSFELPFLEKKFHKYNLTYNYTWKWIDFKDLPSFKYLSKFIGTSRKDYEDLIAYIRTIQTPGKDLAKICQLVLNHPNKTYSELLFSHSQEECFSLINFYNLHQFLVAIHNSTNIHPTIQLNATNESVHSIYFKLTCGYSLDFNFDFLFSCYHIKYTAYEKSVDIILTTRYGTFIHYLDPKEYCIVNNQLLHTSLASFVPHSMKRKATKKECFITNKSSFIPYSEATQEKIWFDNQNISYIEATLDLPYVDCIKSFTKNFLRTTKVR